MKRMIRSTLSWAHGVLFLFALSGLANATVFYIDEFSVIENNQTYWLDTFSDNSAPADHSMEAVAPVDVNQYDRWYLTRPFPQLPGTEADGKLELNTDDGFLNIGTVNPVANRVQRARVGANLDSSFASALTATDSINVTALYDLIEPEQLGELYSIRLTDWVSSTAGEGLELAVRNTLADQWVVEFRQADIGNEWIVLESWDLLGIGNILDYEQISLSLYNDPSAGGDQFSAMFSLLDADGLLMNESFSSSVNGLMFQVSDWLRPEFTVRARVEQVPEPSTILLLALGLPGIAFIRRSR